MELLKTTKNVRVPPGTLQKKFPVSQTLAGIFIFSQCLILMEHLSKMTTPINT